MSDDGFWRMFTVSESFTLKGSVSLENWENRNITKKNYTMIQQK